MQNFSLSAESAKQRQTIRKEIRQKRRSLSAQEQQRASDDLLIQFQQLPMATSANTVALYLAVDGELDLSPVIEWYWQQNKTVCLPVIHPFSNGHLLFLEYTPTTIMVPNQYNIDEPKLRTQDIIPASQIDVIFTPLVAFDDSGQRLGMGGGYYDRTLSTWQSASGSHAIGLAHNCQQVDALPAEAWDVPLQTIITPDKTWQWHQN
ncbi:5-formyltetrahydrofolate cyclo-ligase [Vibrio nigripulchritudo ATCC 27043]|uniref:5-formyltetrahydrofolate cyclo-ligase n=1 Tax=Vibrio nigripulchritudo TaxID=28173 RepID=UPI00021C41A8|nr:5-formyltetrahydrofolate cyclo-ligase [Vibrio nigripulchritudo]EGU60125.1 5-formyltetrahydrofolate cyclo-ligase [Vibrio nigripulchritudo ATCC 27043]